jgi:glycosyltransferase A (GT-A) superfamily protein (DUF2064 family)
MVVEGGQTRIESAPAVLIMARAPRRGEVRRALEPLIGADACLALQAALIVQTVSWARDLGPRVINIAHDPPDAATELRRLAGDDVVLFPQNGDGITGRLADGAARVFARGPGPLLIVWPDLPRLQRIHAQAALDDLASGCDVVLGPVCDGGLYMVAISRPMSTLFKLPESTWRGADAMSLALAAANGAGLRVGVLRVERALHRPADVRAALADPTLPDGLGRLLGRR